MKKIAKNVSLRTILNLLSGFQKIRILDVNEYAFLLQRNYEDANVVYEGRVVDFNIKDENYSDKYLKAAVLHIFECVEYIVIVLYTKGEEY